MTKLANGTPVVVTLCEHHLNCVITGVTCDIPTLQGVSYMYVVNTIDGSLISEDYPYSSMVVHQSMIRE